MNGIMTPVILVVAIGLVASVMLVVASKVFYVPVDERVIKVREALPGANCGGCGFAGCDDYASALVENPDTPCTKCAVGGASTAETIAKILGREAGSAEKMVAHVMCNGNLDASKKILEWQGMQSCKGAKTFFDGMSACRYGCIGLGDCVNACEFDSIGIVNGVAKVDRNSCVACGKCAQVCPQGIIRLVPEKNKVHVMCSSKDKGAIARKNCTNSCIGCGKCTKVCKFDAITVEDNLARIDVTKCRSCGMCVKECPTGAINSLLEKHIKKPVKKSPEEIAALKAKAEAAKKAKAAAIEKSGKEA